MDQTAREMKHADVLYDYIKFHLGLYLATPAALAVVANALGVATRQGFHWGIAGLFVAYFIAALSASWTVASAVNADWPSTDPWQQFGKKASSRLRRFLHHYLYWIGLASGVTGIFHAAYYH